MKNHPEGFITYGQKVSEIVPSAENVPRTLLIPKSQTELGLPLQHLKFPGASSFLLLIPGGHTW